jgi:hypothetical protein
MLGAALGLRLRVLRRRRRCPKRGRRRVRDGVRERGHGEGAGAAGARNEDAGREPVLLVSGMGGSVLHARRRSNPKFDLRVWVRILFANPDFKKYIWSRYNADTGGLGVLPSTSFLRLSGVVVSSLLWFGGSCAQGPWSRWTTMWRLWCRRTITGCSPLTFLTLLG